MIFGSDRLALCLAGIRRLTRIAVTLSEAAAELLLAGGEDMFDLGTELTCNAYDLKDIKWARSVIFNPDLHRLCCITVI